MTTKPFALTSLSAAFLALGFSQATYAADEKIETVYVSATRSETVQVPVATQITVIDSEQIRLSGADTLSEVLRSQAGLQIQDTDGSGRNVSIAMHGFASSSNTLILVDGRKLNNPTLASPALNTISIKDIDRIEIVQGSAGVLFGDQAVGGVINVITQRAKAGEIHGSVNAEKGADNLQSLTANVNQGFTNGLNYSLSAQKRKADNYRDNNDSSNTNVLGNLGYDFESGRVFVERQQINDDLRLPGALLDRDAEINPRQTKKKNDFSNQDTNLKRAGGEFDFLNHWKLLGEYSDRDEAGYAFYDDYTHDRASAKYSPYASAYNMRVKNLTPRVVGTLPVSTGDTIITLGYDQVDADYKTKNGYTSITQEQGAVYGQVIYPITQKVTAIAGIRHADVDDKDHLSAKKHSDSLNASELGLNFQMTSAWRLFARYADGFRFANADENAYTLPTVKFLNPQTSTSEEGGVAWSDKNNEVKYSLYHMTVDNEIMYDPLSGAYGANINLPSSERQGFMFDGRVQLSEEIALHGNYTYTDAQLTSGNYNDKYVPYIAKNTGNVGVVFSFTQHVNLSVDANYTGSRYLSGDNLNEQAKVDAVTLFSTNLLWDYEGVELGLHIKNLTGEKYSDYQGISWSGKYQYPQAGRTYAVHVSYRF